MNGHHDPPADLHVLYQVRLAVLFGGHILLQDHGTYFCNPTGLVVIALFNAFFS
jgi:hypothetical protein